MRNGLLLLFGALAVMSAAALFVGSCQPKESHFGITCSTFEDCDLGQRCFEGRCIQNLREPKNPLEEQEEFAGLTYTTTKMFYNGRVNLPKNFILPYKNLRVLYGKDNFRQSVDPVNGTFWLRLNAVGTSLLVLETNYEEENRNIPIFLTIFPTNGEGYFRRNNIEFSVRETAVALVFLQPALLATVNPFFNAALLERIRNLETLPYLIQMLEDKMTIMSPAVIVSGDIDIQNVVTACVNELFNEIGQEPAAAVGPLGMVNEDDATDTFYHIIYKEILQPDPEEVDNVYIKYYNENGPEVKAYNNMPRWVFYFVDAMPVEASLPGEISDPGIDKEADPALIVPPRNYVSPKLRYMVQRYINEQDDLITGMLLAEGQSNTLNAEINTYYDFEPVTEKTPLKYKKEQIDQGFLVGYLPGPDMADMEARAFDALWATYFTQIVLPMVQLSGDISDNFKTVLLNYDQISGKPLVQHPAYVVSKSIREHGLGLRVNDFMKQRRGSFEALQYKRDLFEKVMEVFQNAFLGRTMSSTSFIADLQEKTGSLSFVTQLQKVSNLVYGQLAPMDIVRRFRGMDAPVFEFTDAVFNHDTAKDIYYFDEADETINNDEDSILYPTEEVVCTSGTCLCTNAGGDIPGCMVLVSAGGMNFSMGSDGGSGWFGAEAYEAEKPRHRVTLEKSFYLDKYEVSVAQYKMFLNDPENKEWLREYASRGIEKCFGDDHYLDVWDQEVYKNGKRDHFPVTGVCWYAANAYCKWADRRLPTEEEWEFAARAVGACVCAATDAACIASNAECNEYPWGNEEIFNAASIPYKANYRNSGDPYEPSKLEKEKIDPVILELMYPAPNLTPVGYFSGAVYPNFTSKPGLSPYGIHDMSGNAEEWVATRFFYYSDLSEGGVPTPVGDQRIVRGGSWGSTRHLIRTSYRRGVNPQNNSLMIGFRCAMDAN